jgi:serine/threonine protein kinase
VVTIDDSTVEAACGALNVKDPQPLRPGGQKSVFKVRSDNDDDLVLKVIQVSGASGHSIRRAEREVELLTRISNEHVVSIASPLVEIQDPPVAVCWLEEFLDGDDLSFLLGTQWPWEDAATMARHVARGLASLHDQAVVHRDLSANNIRRRTNGTYVVMDPGFARHQLRSAMTMAGQPGTPGFMSPEHLQAYSGNPTPYSDVFGVGILLFAALTGEVPIPYRGDDADYVNRLHRVEHPDLASLRPDLDDGQVRVVNRTLHPQPARRFRNGHALAEALEEIEK